MELISLAAFGAMFGIIFQTWSQIKNVYLRIQGFIIQKIEIEGDVALSVLGKIRTEGKDLSSYNKKFVSKFFFVKSEQSIKSFVYEDFPPNTFKIFWWHGPIWIQYKENFFNWYPCSVQLSYIRGKIKIEEELKKIANTKIEITKRFFVKKIFGQHRKNPTTTIIDKETKKNTPPELQRLRRYAKPINFDLDDLGFTSHETAFKNYILTDDQIFLLNNIKNWHSSKDWYSQKGLTWKRGCLLSGKPGTGKTAFVKNIGLELDLPIFVFDLSSLDNEELSLKMTETTEHTPYIMLIEDIDSVFNGRENISGGNLTFDCLINHLDGIADDFGRLLFITTNHPDKLDLALIRPGRLDETFEFKFITYNDRLKMTSFYNVFSELSEMVDDCPVVYFKNLCEIIAVKKRYNEKIDIDKLISITIPEEYQNTKELV